MRYSEGLIVAHACLALAFLVGASLLPPHDDGPTEDCPSQKMVRVVCTCGLGFAVIGFAGLLLALIGLLNLPALFAGLAMFLAAASFYRRESPFQGTYWRSRARALGCCWDMPLLGIYYMMLVLALPALNLTNIGTDPLTYHLAYAADWAAAGRLVVDPFLNPPFYASNFSILYSIFLQLHAHVFVIFLVWVTGLLTILGVFASVRWMLRKQGVNYIWSALTALFLTVAMLFAPSYFRWLISAYIDVPIGAFALMATLSVILGVADRRKDWLLAAAVISGFLIGMKVSFLPFIVVFGIAILIAARGLCLTRSATLAVLAVLLVASSPWYVRNWALAGDPIAPVLNLALYGHDGLTTRFEAEGFAAQLHSVRSPQSLATLPFRAFTDPEGNDFNSDGTSALILTLYVLAVILLVVMPRRKRLDRETLIALFILCMLVGYWALTSTSLRYATVFIPLLPVCLAMTIGLPSGRWPWRGPVIAALAMLTMIPTPDAIDYLHRIYYVQFRDLPASYTSDAQYQGDGIDGYKEVQFAARYLRRMPGPALVYVLGWRFSWLHYYFRLRGIKDAGDWAGPASWFRLYDAIDAGAATQFLNDLGVTAVLIGQPKTILGVLDVPLERQLVSHGYCAVKIPDSVYRFYVRCGETQKVSVQKNWSGDERRT